jgi:osmotically-inducible protein OsmY
LPEAIRELESPGRGESQMSDERAELADRIERAIADKLRMWAINVEVTDETIALQGGVRTEQEYHQAMEVAHQLAGKRGVIDQIIVRQEPTTHE